MLLPVPGKHKDVVRLAGSSFGDNLCERFGQPGGQFAQLKFPEVLVSEDCLVVV